MKVPSALSIGPTYLTVAILPPANTVLSTPNPSALGFSVRVGMPVRAFADPGRPPEAEPGLALADGLLAEGAVVRTVRDGETLGVAGFDFGAALGVPRTALDGREGVRPPADRVGASKIGGPLYG